MFSFRRHPLLPRNSSGHRARKSPRRQFGQSAFERLEAREVFSASPVADFVGPRENHAPVVASPIADVSVTALSPSTTISLSKVFSDPDIAAGQLGDKLTYSVRSNDNRELVSVSVSGDSMTLDFSPNDIKPGDLSLIQQPKSGVSHITVRATDSAGLFVEATFDVTVDPSKALAPPGIVETSAPVDKLYRDLLGRDADAAGRDFWAKEFGKLDGARHVAEGLIASDEHIEMKIKRTYQHYLGREADAQGLAFWREKVWKHLGGAESVFAGIAGSAEYLAKQGGTTTGLVNGMFKDLLGRSADEAGARFWGAKVEERHLPAWKVALEMTETDESSRHLIDGSYQEFLGRGATSRDSTEWTQRMHKGDKLREVELGILASSEYEARKA